MASERLPDQQAAMETAVGEDMARWGIEQRNLPNGALQRIAHILLTREHGSTYGYHVGGNGKTRGPRHYREEGSNEEMEGHERERAESDNS